MDSDSNISRSTSSTGSSFSDYAKNGSVIPAKKVLVTERMGKVKVKAMGQDGGQK